MEEMMRFEQLEILIREFQETRNEDAIEKVLQSYDTYFDKLVNVLVIGKRFNIHDKTQRNFIKLFMNDTSARKMVNGYRKSPVVVQLVQRTVYATRRTLNIHDPEEIKNGIIEIFLDMAVSHDRSGLFGGYINDYFTLRVFSWVVTLLKENQSAQFYEKRLYDVHSYEDTYELEEDTHFTIHHQTPTEFDENWVNGHETEASFATLTPYERRLIKWYYEWRTYSAEVMILPKDIMKERRAKLKHYDAEIADLLGCSRKTVNTKRKEIKEEVERVALSLNKITR